MSTETASTPSRYCPLCDQQLDAEVCPVDGVQTVRIAAPPPEVDPALGRVLGGRYRIERVLGEGAMGRVYAATQLTLGLEVAVKLLHPRLGEDKVGARERQVRRFYREARAATRLTSQHVVRVLDFGVDDETRAPYLVMELLRGETLGAWLARVGPLAPREAARVGAQIGRALVDAHRAGLVHRDLKPANIMRVTTGDGSELVKVTDFGVAKDLLASDTAGLTMQGAAIGTPAYMAPEQVQGLDVDHRVDLYALGCILYELVCGERPYPALGRADSLLGHLLVPPPTLPATLRGVAVPGAFAGLVRALLAKDREARPRDAASVVASLEALANGAEPSPVPRPELATPEFDPAPTPVPAPAPRAFTLPLAEPTLLGRLWDWIRRRPVPPDERLRREARKRRRRWLRHKGLYIGINAGLFGLNVLLTITQNDMEPFSLYVMASWGSLLLFHGLGYRAWKKDNQPLFTHFGIDPENPNAPALPAPSTPSAEASPALPGPSAPPVTIAPRSPWDLLVARCRRAVHAAERALTELAPAAGNAEAKARLREGLADVERLAKGAARLEGLLAEVVPDPSALPEAQRALELTLAQTSDPKLREVYQGHRALLSARAARIEQLRSELTRIRATAEGFALAVENIRLDAARMGAPKLGDEAASLRELMRQLDDELEVLAQVESELDSLSAL